MQHTALNELACGAHSAVFGGFQPALHQGLHGDRGHRVVHIHAHADDAGRVLVPMPATQFCFSQPGPGSCACGQEEQHTGRKAGK